VNVKLLVSIMEVWLHERPLLMLPNITFWRRGQEGFLCLFVVIAAAFVLVLVAVAVVLLVVIVVIVVVCMCCSPWGQPTTVCGSAPYNTEGFSI
jgi:hypothetical protein